MVSLRERMASACAIFCGLLLLLGTASPARAQTPPAAPVPAAPAPAMGEAAASAAAAAVPAPEAGTPADAKADPAQASVVKIFSTLRSPNPYQPWNKGTPVDVTGSGVVIDGNRILTNAHVVLYGDQIQIQDSQGGDKIPATVVAVAPGIDLAVLKLDNDKFFAAHPPLARASVLPEIKTPVMVYGYPKGGDTLSITKGIVSRIEFTPYNYTTSGLRIQIDAAINPGNSGGAALADGKMVGIAFSRLNNAENIGYIIPCEEIELFLKDIADNAGAYKGKATLYDSFQTLENPVLRAFLKLADGAEGVVVTKTFDASPDYPLQPWDVITKIGDTPIDDRGMVKLSESLHIRFTYLIQKLIKNGKVPLTVIRGGNSVQIALPLVAEKSLVIPPLNGTYPSYFIWGPLVFSNASSEYLGDLLKTQRGVDIISGLSARASPLVRRMGDRPAFDGERLVVVTSPFFPAKLSQGYGTPMTLSVKSVNGIPVKNLRHLVEILRDAKDEFVTIDFHDLYSESLVFRRAEALAATDDILSGNGIRSQGSADILPVWTAKPAP